MKTTSLKSRLLIMLLSTIFLVWIVMVLEVYQETEHEISELFDANLSQSANVIYQLLAHEMI